MKCPTCGGEMLHIGHWPHYEDHRRVKDTYVCIAHKPATTVRKEIAA